MRAVPNLAWRLLRGSGGRGLLVAGLSALAVAISTALLLLTLGVNHGFSERAERESWLAPSKAGSDATAVQAVSTDFVDGRPVAVVDLAALEGDAPAPPGMQRFPKPGEVWMSPALGELYRELPDDQLADRFYGSPVGELGRDSMMNPDSLVAIVGHKAGDPVMSASQPVDLTSPPYYASPTRVSDYQGSEPFWYVIYRVLAAFATALVVVPLIVLGAAAGRLATAQRDQRLAAMRLFGATPGQVVGITTFETVMIGAVGALLGAGMYLLSLPLAAQVPATGGTWFIPDLWVGVGYLAATLVAVPLIVGVSALAGLRKLVISPLGVARRQSPRGARVWRLVLFVALIVAYAFIAPSIGMSHAVPFAVFFGILFLALSVVGPFVVGLMGRLMAALARGPKTLLAGRRLVDDPGSAWRTVGGITLAAFVAGFLTVMIPQNTQSLTGETNEVSVISPASESSSIASKARETLRESDIPANVSVKKADGFESRTTKLRSVSITVRGDGANLDRARTALSSLSPAGPPVSSESSSWYVSTQTRDISTASLLVLAVTLVVASTSAAITGVTGVLDRRRTYGLLCLAGTPLSVLGGARLRETVAPLLLLGGGALTAGMFCAFPLSVSAGITQDARSYVNLLGLAALAVAGVAFAELASRLTLRSVTRDPAVRPD